MEYTRLGQKARVGTLAGLAGVISLFGLYDRAQGQDYSQIVLSGTGYALPFNNHPVTQVNVFSEPDNTFLGSETTDPLTGNYTIAFFPVGQGEHKYSKEDMKVLGNPVATAADLELTVLDQDSYTLRVFDQKGEEIFGQKVHLSSGDNRITLSGLGAAGVKFVNVTNGTKSFSSKVLQTESTYFSPAISSTALGPSQDGRLKMSLEELTTDSLLVQFVPPSGYTGTDTIVAPVSQTVNYVLQQNPTYVINTTFKPYDVNGNPANITITIHWPNFSGPDSIKTYIPDTSNEINIMQKLYTSNAIATLELDSVAYTNNQRFLTWIIGRKIHQPRQDSNLFQNPKEWNQFPQPVPVDMNNPDINGKTIYTYFVNKWAHKVIPLISK